MQSTLPATGRQHLLHPLPGAKHHPVFHPHDTSTPVTSCRRGRKVRQGRSGPQERTGHTTYAVAHCSLREIHCIPRSAVRGDGCGPPLPVCKDYTGGGGGSEQEAAGVPTCACERLGGRV